MEKMVNFRVWIEKVQYKPGASCARKCDGNMSKGPRSHLKEAPIGQIGNNLIKKINEYYVL